MQAALSSAGRRCRVAFESGSLTAVQAAVRAGLGVTALLPTSMARLVSSPMVHVLPPLPDIEIGLSRRPESQGDKLVDAVEEMLKQLVRPHE